MAEAKEVESTYSEKKWANFSQKNLFLYLLNNFNKRDCSFVIRNPKDKKSQKVMESFQWILLEISPIFKKLLFTKVHRDRNCKLIPITDPNFETILTYAHTKILRNQSVEQLLNLYESASKYEIESLKDKIIGMLQMCMENRNGIQAKWIGVFEMAYSKKQSDRKLFHLFDRLMQTISTEDVEKALEANIEEVLNLDGDLFYDFLSLLKAKSIRPLLCFRAVEGYLVKIGNKDSIADENLVQDIFNLLLENIDFTKMDLQDFQNGPKASVLLDDKAKEWILGNMHLDQN